MAEITQYKQVNNLFSFWSINTKNRTSKTGSEEWKVILIKSLFLLQRKNPQFKFKIEEIKNCNNDDGINNSNNTIIKVVIT